METTLLKFILKDNLSAYTIKIHYILKFNAIKNEHEMSDV